MLQASLQSLIRQAETDSSLKVLCSSGDTVYKVVLEFTINETSYYLVRCRADNSENPKTCQNCEHIHLSPRERSIVKLVATGLPNKCIAKQLNISPWTVATHLRRIYNKLGVRSKVETIAKLSQENLL
ncbi:MAG: response regulator transcription factor [Cyanobacteria bacterium SID2]|nr:response regulator transcription factor [Cyanobacteria bacterium SID2]MBP0005696.1 response regulator transcription factor [Cyanobacteria bacterium SBC]